MQLLEDSGAVWPLKWSLGVKWLNYINVSSITSTFTLDEIICNS